jgi:uncharacterized protein YbgA (DUF1722 family)/uncharacterized protein YbbK (DUF523 family)
MTTANERTIRIGISSCLLGEKVRYDGGHKHDRFITETLGRFFEWVPVCPEVECGLPTPREAMRLVGDPEAPRLVTIRSGVDHTERMLGWARSRVAALEAERLSGFIFKSKSPSSGMERVRVYNDHGVPSRRGVGLFARAFREHFPLLPVEEDGRLHDLPIRENFIERVFALARWRELFDGRPRRGELVAFHAANKLLLYSHSPELLRELGRLVAGAKALDTRTLFSRYQELFMRALAQRATVKKHVNVLQHMMGYFKRELSADEKRELLEVIDQYRAEQVPLLVPLTLLRHHIRRHGQPYLAGQTYLNPHPVELKLRNHA